MHGRGLFLFMCVVRLQTTGQAGNGPGLVLSPQFLSCYAIDLFFAFRLSFPFSDIALPLLIYSPLLFAFFPFRRIFFRQDKTGLVLAFGRDG
jgi:hypothetical protein